MREISREQELERDLNFYRTIRNGLCEKLTKARCEMNCIKYSEVLTKITDCNSHILLLLEEQGKVVVVVNG